ncbi:phenylacetate-CoA oxygenase/reductase subunit PaaK [Streptomonospora sp. S1-112]|uniref:Phenylacetate-CoA oxygenase/reductase subunit PaaK n=1 Tax=Streptomonospora mangrovi TaxID=2883123 RepID=A0A9X3NT56_9ACTN|nr:1,2-phenylacetyl-CoA epoxidase subunit PaaE [Streptomonospora mangrovi]MDA0567534.1 phenylacetate-CoA oxygenase/reductase subunit PaaK [Streptomonospora mangrovi]
MAGADRAGARRRAPVFHPLRVAAVERLCADAAAVTFEVPAELAAEFAFAPGQSITLRRRVGGVEHRRTYSVCAPTGGPLRIGVREVPGGLFSSWLVREAAPGDVVEAAPPSGAFRADPARPGHHLLIAAGSGITPVLSIAASVLADPRSRATLVYANRTSATVMFGEELADLKDRHPDRFHLVHVLSREPREAELLSGRLDPDRLRRLLAALVPVEAVDDVWLCGPLPLIEGARGVLAEAGVPAERVHSELFYVDEPPPPPRRAADTAPDTAGRLTVLLDGRATTAPLPPEGTLLAAAQAVRADLPFACRGGVCGTCRARVTAGEVDMRRNYALEPAEVEKGFVLTCQSYPRSADVAVDYDA